MRKIALFSVVLLVLACQVIPTPPPLKSTPLVSRTPPPTSSPEAVPVQDTPASESPTTLVPSRVTPSDLSPFPYQAGQAFAQVEMAPWEPEGPPGADIALPVQLEQLDNLAVTAGLTIQQRQFLAENGFVAVHSREAQFIGHPPAGVGLLRPALYYLTSDAAYHAFHLAMSGLTKSLEQEQLRPRLVAITQAVLEDSHLTTGSVTWLAFADRLMEFPTALLGVALGTVLLPNLSAAFAEGRSDDYSRLLDWGLRLIFLLALPAALGLGLLADGIVSVLFQGREFTAHDVRMTSLAVVGYAVGLIGLIAVKILAPGFCAQKDIRTPVKIAVVVLIATQLANLVLVPLFAHAGLALSVSLGACANALALYVGLKRREGHGPRKLERLSINRSFSCQIPFTQTWIRSRKAGAAA